MNEDITKQVGRILIFGVFLILFAPFLMTRTFGLISFENTGQIGDTIGGITAPIASLIGSLLVFYALKAQIEANKLIQDQFNYQKTEEEYRKASLFISEQLLLLRTDIDSFHFTLHRVKGQEKTSLPYKGVEAISKYFEAMHDLSKGHHGENMLKEFPEYHLISAFLKRLSFLIQKIETSNFEEREKEYIFDTVKYTYQVKLKTTLDFFEDYRSSKSETCLKCGKKHVGIPEEIYLMYDEINAKLTY